MRTVFIFMGDPQCSKRRKKKNDYSQWGSLLKTAYSTAFTMAEPEKDPGSTSDANDPMLLVLGGDLVNRGTNEDEWDAFFEAGGETLSSMTVITPTGNHDTRSDTGYETRFPLPANGPEGYEQRFYSYDQGCCHFMVLDTNYMGTRSQKGVRFIQEWMEDDLERNDKPVIFAVMHHPMFTVGSSLDDEVRAGLMRENYLPILHEYGVDFILCGHQHLYCRTFPQYPEDDSLGSGSRRDPEKYDTEAGFDQDKAGCSSAAGLDQDKAGCSSAAGSTQDAARCAGPEDPGIVQIMGVSGTKYYHGPELSKMEAVKEDVSAATIISAEDSISITTMDPSGNIIDSYKKPIRPKKPKTRSENVLKQPLFSKKLSGQQTPGTNAYIINKHSSGYDEDTIRDPFCSGKNGGITVRLPGSGPFCFSDEQLQKMQWEEMHFSTLRGTELKQEIRYALPLENILKECGWHSNRSASIHDQEGLDQEGSNLEGMNPDVMHIVSRYGKTTTVRLDEILDRKRFVLDPDGSYKEFPVRAAICIEDEEEPAGSTSEPVPSYKDTSNHESDKGTVSGIDGAGKTTICYRLVFGQHSPDEYNTRQWIRNIAELELIELPSEIKQNWN